MVKDNKNLCKELLSKQTNYIGNQIIGDNNTVTQQNFNINFSSGEHGISKQSHSYFDNLF